MIVDVLPLASPGPPVPAASADHRPRMPDPPPVRLAAIEDVEVQAAAGLECDLDRFYGALLGFVRAPADEGWIHYRAENATLRVRVVEPPLHRPSLRTLRIEAPRLLDVARRLGDAAVPFHRHGGLTPACDELILQDPAGNWLAIAEVRNVL